MNGIAKYKSIKDLAYALQLAAKGIMEGNFKDEDQALDFLENVTSALVRRKNEAQK